MRDRIYVEEMLREWARQEAQRHARLPWDVGPAPGFAAGVPGGLRRLAAALKRRAPGRAGTAASALPLRVLRLRDVPPVRAPFVRGRESIVEALRLLEGAGTPGLLTTYRGRPAVLTPLDIALVLPSPTAVLARHEVPDLLTRVTVAEAVRGPAPVAHADEDVRRAAALMRAAGWGPLVVMDGGGPCGLVTAGTLVEALVGPDRTGERPYPAGGAECA